MLVKSNSVPNFLFETPQKKEYKLSNLISSIKTPKGNFISPHIYGLFNCKPTELYNDETYLVMEKIYGNSLDDSSLTKEEGINNINKYLNQIFEIQNLLYDKGFILNDLNPRNIIITKDNKAKFIDFDDMYTIYTGVSIPLSDRLSKEKLKKNLIDDYLDWYEK